MRLPAPHFETFKDIMDITDNIFVADISLNGIIEILEAFMSRLLVQERQEKELSRLQGLLTNAKKGSAGNSVSLTKKDAHSIAALLDKIITEKPLVVDSYVTPNEAAKLAGVSRPVVIEMLKNGGLRGHMVKSHWRVQKSSLLEYINGRDKTFQSMAAMDADGYGLDK